MKGGRKGGKEEGRRMREGGGRDEGERREGVSQAGKRDATLNQTKVSRNNVGNA